MPVLGWRKAKIMMSHRWVYLSHFLHPGSPVYGEGWGFREKKEKQMENGDTCNTSRWTLSNHMGTHIDFPRHFSIRGRTLNDYPPDYFMFTHIHLVDISPVEPGKIVGPDDMGLSNVSKNTELLLIKTGFGKHRGNKIYWEKNPGFDPGVADYLRGLLPRVRVMGFDVISLSSYARRSLGHQAHNAFLNHTRPILPLEDMDLSQADETKIIHRAMVAPLLVSGSNGSPCTVMAKIEKTEDLTKRISSV